MPSASSMSRRDRREALEALAFLSPWIIGFLLFTAGPVIGSFVLSFFRWDVISPPKFLGLGNYRELLRDEVLRKALSNTAIYAAMMIPGSIVAALALALLLNQKLA